MLPHHQKQILKENLNLSSSYSCSDSPARVGRVKILCILCIVGNEEGGGCHSCRFQRLWQNKWKCFVNCKYCVFWNEEVAVLPISVAKLAKLVWAEWKSLVFCTLLEMRVAVLPISAPVAKLAKQAVFGRIRRCLLGAMVLDSVTVSPFVQIQI